MSGITERAIENWLTNASERGYQVAFCHLLNAMGYSVVHSTTHTPIEEGKDIIAKDARGRAVAFQLKRGKINVTDWRNMESEINELVENSIRHPSIGNNVKHKPILVTTGSINENVISRIDTKNRSWRQRNYKPLKTWSYLELVSNFKKYTYSFLPQQIPEFHRLLGFMINEGSGPLDKDEFDLLLKSVLPLSKKTKKLSKINAARSITASAVIVEYALAGFDRVENHFAKIEAYTMLFCYIRAVAIRLKLKEKLWMPTVNLIENAIDMCAKQLFEERKILEGFGQGSPLTEPIVASYRKTLLGGIMAAHGLWSMLGGKSVWYHENKGDVVDAVVRCVNNANLPAESFVPARFMTSEFLRNNGHIREGDAIFLELLKHCVLRKQDNKHVRPLWGPYLSIEEVILRDLGKQSDSLLPESWKRNSHTVHSLILVAATRLLRQVLGGLWHPITSLHLNEFVPDQVFSGLLWRNRKGVMIQKMVSRPQSWTDLQKEAISSKKMPNAFTKMIHWLPYYFLVYPHRFNPGAVLALCDAIH